MNVEDQEWVQHALMDYERKRSISKVLSINCKNAVPKGNNYGSDMFRLDMKAVLYSGDVVNRSLIYKALPVTEVRRALMVEAKVHVKENKMYTEILPEMERIQLTKNPGIQPIAPICYGVRAGNVGYLLEDLNESGYKMADRLKGLDYDHALVAVKSLAEFHALSLVLIERRDIAVDDFKGNFFVENPGKIDPMVLSTLEELIKIIEEKWEGEWKVYADKLREFSKTVMTRFVDCLRFNEKNFNVLVHGDYWTTNMMFRYNTQGVPVNSRLLDFQLCNYNNIGLDLQYLFYTSLTADALKRKDELLQWYYENLKSFLTLYGLPEKAPSFEDLLTNYERANFYGLSTGLFFKPLMMQPTEAVPHDLEEWTKEIVDNKKAKSPKIDMETISDALKLILEHGRSSGFL